MLVTNERPILRDGNKNSIWKATCYKPNGRFQNPPTIFTLLKVISVWEVTNLSINWHSAWQYS